MLSKLCVRWVLENRVGAICMINICVYEAYLERIDTQDLETHLITLTPFLKSYKVSDTRRCE